MPSFSPCQPPVFHFLKGERQEDVCFRLERHDSLFPRRVPGELFPLQLPVAYDIPCFLILRLYHTGKEIPAIVRKRERRRHRLVQDKRPGGIIEHEPGSYWYAGGFDDWFLDCDSELTADDLADYFRATVFVGVANGIGGGVHPSAHDDPLPKVLEDGAVVLHLRISFPGCGKG